MPHSQAIAEGAPRGRRAGGARALVRRHAGRNPRRHRPGEHSLRLLLPLVARVLRSAGGPREGFPREVGQGETRPVPKALEVDPGAGLLLVREVPCGWCSHCRPRRRAAPRPGERAVVVDAAVVVVVAVDTAVAVVVVVVVKTVLGAVSKPRSTTLRRREPVPAVTSGPEPRPGRRDLDTPGALFTASCRRRRRYGAADVRVPPACRWLRVRAGGPAPPSVRPAGRVLPAAGRHVAGGAPARCRP